MKINNKGFSTIEILFIVVIISVLLIAGISIATMVRKKEQINTFKEKIDIFVIDAKTAFKEYEKEEKNEYIVSSEDGKSKGMCITLKGLSKNHFYSKDLKDWDGYIVVEKKDETLKATLWITDGKLVISGYEASQIKDLSTKEKQITNYKQESFSSQVKNTFTGTTYEKGGTGTKDGSVKKYNAICINEKIE